VASGHGSAEHRKCYCRVVRRIRPRGQAVNFLELLRWLVDTGSLRSILLVWKQIRRFSALERPARVLFLRASVLLPLISISLRWRGFCKTKASLEQFLSVPFGSQNPDAQGRAALTARMVRAAGHYGLGHPTASRYRWRSGGYWHGSALLPPCAWEFARTQKNLRHRPGSSMGEQP